MNRGCPIVIGGVGGSGTRVYARLAKLAGVRMMMRAWNDPQRAYAAAVGSGDCKPLIEHFYAQWVDRYTGGHVRGLARRRMAFSLRYRLWTCDPWLPLRRLVGKAPRWGWKNPRTLFVLPFLNELYPSMRYIHVVRDGRDHAFHPRFSYHAHAPCLLGAQELALPDHIRKALVWARENELGRQCGEQHLRGRYLVSKLEDLCADPVGQVRRILEFIGVQSEELVERGALLVATPSTLGRWRSESACAIAEAEAAMADALVRYGYSPEHHRAAASTHDDALA